MDVNKVLFISQEITPYLPETPMSVMGRTLPQAVQESGLEVRTFMPKYGFINERRNQLHEVIRLSGMNISIDDADHPLIIKVATLQPVRMQVYFIFNEDFFQKSVSKELETVSSPSDNDERSIFFVRGTLETVKKLRWVPEVIHCTGLIAALAPLYIKDFYADDPSYQGSKVVYSLTNDEFSEPFDVRLYEKLQFDGLKEDNIAWIKGQALDKVALTKLALQHCDGVVQAEENVSDEILQLVKESGLPFLPYQSDLCTNADAIKAFYQSL